MRLPDSAKFSNYVDIPALHLSPSQFAEDVELGKNGKMFYFRLEKKSILSYTLYKGISGQNRPRTQLGTYQADDLFGRWIDVNYTIDMKTGKCTYSFDGKYIGEADMNYTDWSGTSYLWNSENYLRYCDFAFNATNSDFVMDIKDMTIIRKVSN